MGRGKKTQQFNGGFAPGKGGKNPHYRCPSESYNSLWFRMHGALPSIFVPLIFSSFPSGIQNLIQVGGS